MSVTRRSVAGMVVVYMRSSPGTEVIHVGKLKGAWGKANPFLLVRREGVTHTRFVAFIEPYGVWDAKESTGEPRLKDMKRLAVTDAAGKELPDQQAAAVELDFGDKRVVILLNDTDGEIKAGGLSTAKRFSAGYRQ